MLYGFFLLFEDWKIHHMHRLSNQLLFVSPSDAPVNIVVAVAPPPAFAVAVVVETVAVR